ncbi:unnamed protein product [Commensalibacter communis]|uniref:Uncharacterized protein n=1 Tax=Commensalibacter communis TaxID=2972786 RepID=A0A9W4X7C3_9PROT|nr:hypothetical protein [Commensalibacter communis]CAI3953882.1 unnamed protein product [Commensalibacter communis]CAI3956300.1 unnamed protein product [Commensalibacter communis]CAI3956686.1 unnamed protein product [Commensalibacter communis]CAI3956978.1 unnamed protein product [Commensalibacter communis]
MSKVLFRINKTSLDYNEVHGKTTLSIKSCLPRYGVNRFDDEMRDLYCPLLPYFWVKVFIGKPLYIHFKNTALVDGQYIYEADQYRLKPPDEKEHLCSGLLFFDQGG